MFIPRRSDGMTLIELLIVLVIVAILAAMAIPRFNNMVDKTKISSAETELKHATDGLWFYKTENDSLAFPVSSLITDYNTLRALVADYIGWLPEEANAKFTFVSYTADDTSFTLRARAKDMDRTLLESSLNGIIHP
jgi:prepilin-type N-terminal cleavage/methylation domain-containing protein